MAEKILNKKNTTIVFFIYFFLIILSMFYILWLIYDSKFKQCSDNINPQCQRLICNQTNDNLKLDPQNQILGSMFNSMIMQSDLSNAEENGWEKGGLGKYGNGYCEDNIQNCNEDGTKCCYVKNNEYGIQDYNTTINPIIRDQFNQLNIEVLYNQFSKQINKICKLLEDDILNTDPIKNICIKEADGKYNVTNILNRNLIETLLIVNSFAIPNITLTNNNEYRIDYKTCNVDKCNNVYTDQSKQPIWGRDGEQVSSNSNCYTCSESYNNYYIIIPNLNLLKN